MIGVAAGTSRADRSPGRDSASVPLLRTARPAAVVLAILIQVSAAMPTLASGPDPAAIATPPALSAPPEAARLVAPVALERPATQPTPAQSPRRQAPATIDWRLMLVLVAGFAAIGGLRLLSRRQQPRLPPDVFDVLGEASLGGPHSVRIVRFGPKTLLVGVSASGCQTLAELTDPQATACIAAACRGVQPPLRPRPAFPLRSNAAIAILLAGSLAVFLGENSAVAEPPGEPAAMQPVAPAPLAPQPAATPLAAAAQPIPSQAAASPADRSQPGWAAMLSGMLETRSLDATLSAALMFGVASLAPAVLLMTTSFVRMSVVLSLLRQGLGTQQLPSNQIVTSLALFLSAMVMWPIWTQAYRDGVEPYQQGRIELSTAYERGTLPIRRWMAGQIEHSGNRDTMLLFLSRHPSAPKQVATYDDVPVETLLPAFLVSELKTSFAIGFRLLLPFLVLDLLVATLVVATGLVMLPPTLVSLPLKLLVFVMADGWSLVVQSLLDSVQTSSG